MRAIRFAAFVASAFLSCAAFAQDKAAKAAPSKATPKREVILDLIVLVDGKAINGVIKVDKWNLKTKWGNLVFPKGDVRSIEPAAPPRIPKDEIQITAITRIDGDMTPTEITIDVEETGQMLKIPKSDIRAIWIAAGEFRSVSEGTRKQLEALKRPGKP